MHFPLAGIASPGKNPHMRDGHLVARELIGVCLLGSVSFFLFDHAPHSGC
jgi:hypothetical protein